MTAFSTDAYVLAGLMALAAVLYSSVGHAGASGYLAAMALMGVQASVMKPTALVLNILVASVTVTRFYRAGLVNARSVLPFLLGSAPLAFVGGLWNVPSRTYKIILGAVLLLSAARLVVSSLGTAKEAPVKPVPLALGVASGAAIGLLAGLTGTGGGIFLSPLLLALHWADPRSTAAMSAVFILVNSLAGLGGNLVSLQALPGEIPLWAVAVLAGGFMGSGLGATRLNSNMLRRLLALVLTVAGLKLVFS